MKDIKVNENFSIKNELKKGTWLQIPAVGSKQKVNMYLGMFLPLKKVLKKCFEYIAYFFCGLKVATF